jgi:hypothetical protein
MAAIRDLRIRPSREDEKWAILWIFKEAPGEPGITVIACVKKHKHFTDLPLAELFLKPAFAHGQ